MAVVGIVILLSVADKIMGQLYIAFAEDPVQRAVAAVEAAALNRNCLKNFKETLQVNRVKFLRKNLAFDSVGIWIV
jgi:hypothetical protein